MAEHRAARLSALLYELTGNNTYNAAAERSATFVAAHLYNDTVVLNDINAANCSRSRFTASIHAGLFIDGLSIHAGTNKTWNLVCVYSAVV